MADERRERPEGVPWIWMLRSRIATKGSLDALFRLFGAKTVLPDLFFVRPLLSGAQFLDVREAFSRIKSWNDWVLSWSGIAEKRETYAALAEEEGRLVTARENWIWAAAAHHMAQFLLFEEVDRKREIYRRSAACYRRGAALLDPPAEPVAIPHGAIEMAGVLRLPSGEGKRPLVVLLCGADGSKEEMHFFAEGFVRRGIGALAMDGPGIGETWDLAPLGGGDDPVGTSVFDFLSRDGRIDEDRIALFGVSFGGTLGLRMAAAEPRFRAVVTLTAPYDLSAYDEYVMPVIREQVMYLLHSDSEEGFRKWAKEFSVRGVVAKIEAPILVIGGGEDVFVPGDHAKRIFEEARGRKKMVFFQDSDHLCTEFLFDLVGKVEEWLIEIGFVSAAKRGTARP
ncbi:MAG: prolyl oligopeptidase family serine peptidase [Candidatus Eisenbacteria bacterium]